MISEGAIPSGVRGRAVVGVNHVTGGAAAGTVIAGAVVRSEEVEQRIVEAGLVRADDDGIDPREGAETALAEAAPAGSGRRLRALMTLVAQARGSPLIAQSHRLSPRVIPYCPG